MTPKAKTKDIIKLRERLTNTTYFILPIFKVPLLKLDEYGFVNAYLYDKNRKDTEPDGKTIYVLFRPNDLQKVPLQKQIEDWENNGFLIDDYDYPDGYIVVSLRFPNKYKDQYKLFIQGKYSEFSEDYKEQIPRKITGILPSGEAYDDDSLQFLVINKRVRLKNYWRDQLDVELTPDMEYWSKPIIEDETMDIDKITEERIKKDESRNNKDQVS